MRKRKKLKILFVFLTIIVVIFFLNVFSKGTRSFFYTISTPIQKPLWKLGSNVSSFFESIFKINSFKKDRDQFKIENQELIVEISNLKDLRKENEVLRKALNLNLEKEFKLIMSELISKDIFDQVLLNLYTSF